MRTGSYSSETNAHLLQGHFQSKIPVLIGCSSVVANREGWLNITFGEGSIGGRGGG